MLAKNIFCNLGTVCPETGVKLNGNANNIDSFAELFPNFLIGFPRFGVNIHPISRDFCIGRVASMVENLHRLIVSES
jgi:hypothetical protein